MADLHEQELVKGVLRGDVRQEEALYRRYHVPMFRVCLRYARNREEAEDMLQEGFLRVFSDLPGFRFEGSLEGWIRRVVVRACLRLLRQRQVFEPLDAEPEASAAEGPESSDPRPEGHERQVIRLLQMLPPGYRTVLNLFVIEGYSHEEISGLLNISSGTSRSQLSKARSMLKKLLDTTLTHHP